MGCHAYYNPSGLHRTWWNVPPARRIHCNFGMAQWAMPSMERIFLLCPSTLMRATFLPTYDRPALPCARVWKTATSYSMCLVVTALVALIVGSVLRAVIAGHCTRRENVLAVRLFETTARSDAEPMHIRRARMDPILSPPLSYTPSMRNPQRRRSTFFFTNGRGAFFQLLVSRFTLKSCFSHHRLRQGGTGYFVLPKPDDVPQLHVQLPANIRSYTRSSPPAGNLLQEPLPVKCSTYVSTTYISTTPTDRVPQHYLLPTSLHQFECTSESTRRVRSKSNLWPLTFCRFQSLH